eukprot:958863-Prymnesium_polylepis.1
MINALFVMRAAEISVDVGEVSGLKMTVSARAAENRSAAVHLWKRASLGIPLLMETSLAVVEGTLLRDVGLMLLLYRQLFDFDCQLFSGGAGPLTLALVVGVVV